MSMRSCMKSITMRLSLNSSVARTPSAPPIASITIGNVAGLSVKSPTVKESTRTVGTIAIPVTPCNRTGGD